MTILNNPNPRKSANHTCSVCGCTYSYTAEDIRHDKYGAFVDCPNCEARFYISLEESTDEFEKLVKKISEECFNNFHISEIVDYMHNRKWTWVGRDINESTFIQFGTDLIRNILEKMRKYVKDNPDLNLSDCNKTFSVRSGGFSVHGYFVNNERFEISLKFIADEEFTSSTISNLIK